MSISIMILDSEFWREVPRVTEQDNLVIIPILDLRYSDFYFTQQNIEITSKSALTCSPILAEMDFSDLVCNLGGWVRNIPSDMLAFAYYPYGALGRIEYLGHKDICHISRCKRGGKDGEEQKTKDRIDEGRDARELHDGIMFEVDVDKDM